MAKQDEDLLDDDIDLEDDDDNDNDSDIGDDEKESSQEKDDDFEIIEDEKIVTKPQRPEETQEEKRERRRKEKQEKRQKRLNAERRDKQLILQQQQKIAELERWKAEIDSRGTQLEQRQQQQEELQLDQHIQQQKSIYDAALAKLNQAITEGNGAAAAEAQRYIDDARTKHTQLVQLKQSITTQRSRSEDKEEKPVTQQIDPRQKIHAARWHADNDWFDPRGNDEDSLIAKGVDQDLIREGYSPAQRDYWDELTARLKQELPHRYKTKRTTTPKARQTNGSVSLDSHTPSSTRLQIPKSTVELARNAGMWDDPAKQKLFIKNWKIQNGLA